jgi:transposase InsO family protein
MLFRWRVAVPLSNAVRSFIQIAAASRQPLEFRRLLYVYGFRQSIKAKGKCYDNALRRRAFFRDSKLN